MLNDIKNNIPVNVRKFLLRAIILVVCWELLYNLLLKPTGIPDDQLTRLVQWGSMHVLSIFYTDISSYESAIIINGEKAVSIARQCNGLELIVLYIGFIVCLPSTWKKMLAFGIIGTIVIYILNILRTAGLAAMYAHQHSMTDFAHHYLFKIVIYAVVFAGWVLYMKKNNKNATEN